MSARLQMPAGRFVKGKSGNPKGRPLKAKLQAAEITSAFDIVTNLTLPLMQDGQMREVSLQEALILKTYQDALNGSQLARKKIIKMIEDRDALRAKRQKVQTVKAQKISFRTTASDPANADTAMLILGIAQHDASRASIAQKRAQLLLEPWAVQLALRRRRSAVPRSATDVLEITRCTRDSATLHWPRGSRE